jgi:hypothetical protein
VIFWVVATGNVVIKHRRFGKLVLPEDEGKRPLGRPRRRWEDNIKMDLREIGVYGAN